MNNIYPTTQLSDSRKQLDSLPFRGSKIQRQAIYLAPQTGTRAQTPQFILLIAILFLIGGLVGMIGSAFAAPNSDNIYIQAQNEFVKDMSVGKHKHKATDANKCKTINSDTGKPFSIAAIVYAINYNESSGGTVGQSIKSNNWSSLHPQGSYYYVWDGKSKTDSVESLRIYKSPKDNIKDTMYLIKYAYGCHIDWNHIAYYIYGKGPYNQYNSTHKMTRGEFVTVYRDRLIQKAKEFEKMK